MLYFINILTNISSIDYYAKKFSFFNWYLNSIIAVLVQKNKKEHKKYKLSNYSNNIHDTSFEIHFWQRKKID